jgi:hypothetical protein
MRLFVAATNGMGTVYSREVHTYHTTEDTAMTVTDLTVIRDQMVEIRAESSDALLQLLGAAGVTVTEPQLQGMACGDPSFDDVAVQETVTAVGRSVLSVAHLSSRRVDGVIMAAVRMREVTATVDARSRVIHNEVVHKNETFRYHNRRVLSDTARALTAAEVASLRAQLQA